VYQSNGFTACGDVVSALIAAGYEGRLAAVFLRAREARKLVMLPQVRTLCQTPPPLREAS
jgi:hypothetical protein